MFHLKEALQALEKKRTIGVEILDVIAPHLEAGDSQHVCAALAEVQNVIWQHIPGNGLIGVYGQAIPFQPDTQDKTQKEATT